MPVRREVLPPARRSAWPFQCAGVFNRALMIIPSPNRTTESMQEFLWPFTLSPTPGIQVTPKN